MTSLTGSRDAGRTDIFKTTLDGEHLIGYVDDQGEIYEVPPRPEGTRTGARMRQGAVGRVDDQRRLFRYTTHDEREVGQFASDGRIRSHGLFEGGELGWVEPNGVVVQAGLIFGEEEVGRVSGPQPAAAAAALLLIFLPDDAEANRGLAR